MADVAESAVLVSSAGAAEAITKLTRVQGPSGDFHNAAHVLGHYPAMGFQATNYGRACHIAERMLRRQAPSKVYQMKDGQYVLVRHDADDQDGDADEKATERPSEKKPKKDGRDRLVYPTLFLGVTANLFGTGCREAIRFLVQEGIAPNPNAAQQKGREGRDEAKEEEEEAVVPEDASEDQVMFARLKKEYREAYGRRALADESTPAFRSFLACLVVSGGGVEHDVRRACADYTVTRYASERMARPPVGAAHFGNISYPAQGSPASALFDDVMTRFVRRLCERQERLHAAATAKPIPEKYLDVCSWSVTPSEVWALLGLWLVELLTEALQARWREEKSGDDSEAAVAAAAAVACRADALARARTTVVYWAALQQVPLYSPSFVDGDIASYILPAPSPGAEDANTAATEPLLQVDLVRDIHSINKLAMQSKKTGMLICGGGVVKHHICNANLMRNGADYTVILNNGQEFDGSDAGAKPEEALSWGKVRMEGEFVKVYGEITTYLPLLVAQVFVPAVRRRPGSRQRDAAPPAKEQEGAAAAAKGDKGGDSGEGASKKTKRCLRKPRGQRRETSAGKAAEIDSVPVVEDGEGEEEKATH